MAVDIRRAGRMTPLQKRDLPLLAACYDRSRAATFTERWKRLVARLGLRSRMMLSSWPTVLGWAGTAVVALVVLLTLVYSFSTLGGVGFWLAMAAILGASWFMHLRKRVRMGRLTKRILGDVHVIPRHHKELRSALMGFWEAAIQDQPVPVAGPSDVRYQLLAKFEELLKELGFSGTIILMDRVDEPHLINGSPEAMRDFIWPLLDNKLLKQPGIGFKLLLPIELSYFLPKESKEFYERSRLDKQNTVRSLEWSGQSLYDMACERLTASLPPERLEKGERLTLRELVDDDLATQEMVHSLGFLRVPRHLFKFLYRLITEHCDTYTSDEPVWRIRQTTFQTTLKLYLRDLEAFDKGYGHG
jgi:hypothetical protein